MGSRFRSLAEDEVQNYLGEVAAGRAGRDPEAVKMAKSRNPREARVGARLLDRQDYDQRRQAAMDQAEANRQAKEEQQRQVRIAADQGQKIVTDPESGLRTPAILPTGQPEYVSGEVGKPRALPAIQQDKAKIVAGVPGFGDLMQNDQIVVKTPHEPAQGKALVQDYRNPEGQIKSQPLPTHTDPKTGQVTVTTKDAWGAPQKVDAGVDTALRAKLVKDAELEQRKAALDLRANTLDQARTRFDPQWKGTSGAKHTYDQAAEKLKAFDANPRFMRQRDNYSGADTVRWVRRNPLTGEPKVYLKDVGKDEIVQDEEGQWTMTKEHKAGDPWEYDPLELVKWQQDRAQLQAEHDRTKAAHDKLLPQAEALNAAENAVKAEHLKLAAEKLQHEHGLPDVAKGAAETLASEQTGIPTDWAQVFIEEMQKARVAQPPSAGGAGSAATPSTPSAATTPAPPAAKYPEIEPKDYDAYFKAHPEVSGMAVGAGLNGTPKNAPRSVVINPYAKLTPEGRKAVLVNERLRHFMDENKPSLKFDPTPEQIASFKGTEYGKPENKDRLKETLIARIITGDESAGKITPEQQAAADEISKKFDAAAPTTTTRPLVPLDDPAKVAMFAKATQGFADPAKLTVVQTGTDRITLIKSNKEIVGSYQQDAKGNPFLVIARSQEGLRATRHIDFEAIDGVPIFLSEPTSKDPMVMSTQLNDPVAGAKYVAEVFQTARDSAPNGPEDVQARLNEIGATPDQLAMKLYSGELSVQQAQSIAKGIYGISLKADDPSDPGAFAKWMSKQDADTKSAWNGAKNQLEKNIVKLKYLQQWEANNGWKPSVDQKSLENAILAVISKPQMQELQSQMEPGTEQKGVGDFVRGAQVSLRQFPQLAMGMVGLFGQTAEKLTGVGTAMKNWGYEGYKDAEQKAQPYSRDSDDVSKAWAKAKEGNIGAMIDWAQYGLGYVVGQAGETIAMSWLGGLIGAAATSETGPGAAVGAAGGAVTGLVAKGAVKTAAKSMIEKAIAKGAMKMAEKEAAAIMAKSGVEMTAEQIAKRAGSAELRKAVARDIGSTIAITANSLQMELGSIAPEAVRQAQDEGREMTGTDLARVWATGIVAGGIDALTDKLGIDLLKGKMAKKLPAGRIAAGATAAAVGALVEGGTELAQTYLERLGARQAVTGPEAQSDYINSTALGALGGGAMGGGAAVVSHRNAKPGTNTAPETSPIIPPPDNQTGPEWITPRGLEISASSRLSKLREKRDGKAEEIDEKGKVLTINTAGRPLNPEEKRELDALEAAMPDGGETNHAAIAQLYGKKLKTPTQVSSSPRPLTPDQQAVVAERDPAKVAEFHPNDYAKWTDTNVAPILGTPITTPEGLGTVQTAITAARVQGDEITEQLLTAQLQGSTRRTDFTAEELGTNDPAFVEQTNNEARDFNQALANTRQRLGISETPTANQTDGQNLQGQTGPKTPAQAAQPATGATATPGTAGMGGTGTGQAAATQAPIAADLAALPPEIFAGHQSANPQTPDAPAVVAAAFAAGKPVHARMARRTGATMPDTYHQVGDMLRPKEQAPVRPAVKQEHMDAAVAIAGRVQATIVASMPRLKGKVFLKDNINEAPTGGVEAITDGTINLLPRDIAVLVKNHGAETAEKVIHIEVVRHELRHMAQVNYAQAKYEEAKKKGYKGDFMGFWNELYGKGGIYSDLMKSPKLMEICKQIYDGKHLDEAGTSPWDQIQGEANQAAEAVRILLEIFTDPTMTKERASVSELLRAEKNENTNLVALLKDLVRQLTEWLGDLTNANSPLEPAVKEHLAGVDALYRELISPASTPSSGPGESVSGDAPTTGTAPAPEPDTSTKTPEAPAQPLQPSQPQASTASTNPSTTPEDGITTERNPDGTFNVYDDGVLMERNVPEAELAAALAEQRDPRILARAEATKAIRAAKDTLAKPLPESKDLELSKAMDGIVDELLTMPAEQRLPWIEQQIEDWLAPIRAEEAAQQQRSKEYRDLRDRLKARRRERARQIIDGSDLLTKMAEQGMLESPPDMIGAYARQRNGKPPTQADIDAKDHKQAWDDIPLKSQYAKGPNGTLISAVMDQYMAPPGSGIAPDVMAGALGMDLNEFADKLQKELRKISRGQPEGQLSDEEIGNLSDKAFAEYAANNPSQFAPKLTPEEQAAKDAKEKAKAEAAEARAELAAEWTNFANDGKKVGENTAARAQQLYDEMAYGYADSEGMEPGDATKAEYKADALAQAREENKSVSIDVLDSTAAKETEARKKAATETPSEDKSIFTNIEQANHLNTIPNPGVVARVKRWISAIPGFQGNKSEMAAPVTQAIDSAMTPEQRAHFTEADDYFGGGGSWAILNALVSFPNIKRLRVWEIDTYRMEKIRMFHEKGNAMGAILGNPSIRDILINAADNAKASGNISGSAIASNINLSGISDPIARGAAKAIKDYCENSFGTAADEDGTKNAHDKLAMATRIVTEQAKSAYDAAQAFRNRGGSIEYRNDNSYQSQQEKNDRTLAFVDPPYFLTKGYDQQKTSVDMMGEVAKEPKAKPQKGSAADRGLVDEKTYAQTASLLNRLVDAGHGIVYTDSAWWRTTPKDQLPKGMRPTPAYFDLTPDMRRVFHPVGRRTLSDISGLLDRFGVVSGKIGADRNEVLGIHYGNQPTTDTGRGSRPERHAPDNENQGSTDRRNDQPGGGIDTAQQAVGGVAAGTPAETGAVRSGTGNPVAPKDNWKPDPWLLKSSPEPSSGPLDHSDPYQGWRANSLEPGILVGYRGEPEGTPTNADNGFGSSEGVGLYISQDERNAQFFGDTRRMSFPKPKSPVIVDEDAGGDTIPMLNEESPIWERILAHKVEPGDSDWIKAHILAAKRIGLTEEAWQKMDDLPRALTDILMAMGHDAVYARSGGMDWTVLLTTAKGRLLHGTRSETGRVTLYSSPSPTAPARTRPKSLVEFEKPFRGPSGAEIVAYEWKDKLKEKMDAPGEDKTYRASNWSDSDINHQTGREIVHQFHVRKPDGTAYTTSMESALKMLGYTLANGKDSATVRTLASMLRNRAKLAMQADALRTVIDKQNVTRRKYDEEYEALRNTPMPAPHFISEPGKTEMLVDGYLERFGPWATKERFQETDARDLREMADRWRDREAFKRAGGDGRGPEAAMLRDIESRIVKMDRKIQRQAAMGESTEAGTPDMLAAINAPDATQRLGDVKVGTMSALGAYRALTAKREAGKALTADEQDKLTSAEQALGQKMAQQVPQARLPDSNGQMRLFSSPSPTNDNPAPFYSQLSRSIEAKMPKTATPAQVLQIAASGAKAEEVKWSGLAPWLQGRDKVTKDEVLRYLADEGAVRFEEQTASDNPKYDDDGNLVGKDFEVKFGQYQLPGGENYREVVLAMPSVKNQYTITKAYHKYRNADWYFVDDSGGKGGGVWKETLKEAQDYADMLWKQMGAVASGKSYTSTHFPNVPNYVAHMRTNERDGGLFIEELQSDRHQAGRKKGYKGGNPEELKAAQEEMDAATSALEKLQKLEATTLSYDPAHAPLADKIKQAHERQQAAWRAFDELSGVIPDAPFRTTWPLALFKRALRDAVAGGKSWIGWTTGETQAERYDLGKQVDSLDYKKVGDSFSVIAVKDGEVAIKRDATASELEGLVGKEVAQKMMSGDGKSIDRYEGKGYTRLEGLDLQVGGSGMKGFYDNMLPKEIGKYVKQWGGKVEQSTIGVKSPYVPPEFKAMPKEEEEAWSGADNFKNGDAPVIADAKLFIDGKRESVKVLIGPDAMHIVGPDGTQEWIVPKDSFANWKDDWTAHIAENEVWSRWRNPQSIMWRNVEQIGGDYGKLTPRQFEVPINPVLGGGEFQQFKAEGCSIYGREANRSRWIKISQFVNGASAEDAARQLADAHNKAIEKNETGENTIWRVNITDDMRKGVKEGQALFSSPNPATPAQQAVNIALAKMPPIYLGVFEAVQAGSTVPEVMAKFNVNEKAVGNILDAVRSRIATATAAAGPDGLKPVMRGDKIMGGRPDLAGSTLPHMAAIHQIRNESGMPGVVNYKEIEGRARKTVFADLKGVTERLIAKRNSGESFTLQEVAEAKITVYETFLAGEDNTPEARANMEMLNTEYIDQGSEDARKMGIRRDPNMSPAERAAQYIIGELYTPDEKTRKAMRKAGPTDRVAIMAGWTKTMDRVKAELLAQGIDLDATLKEFRKNQQAKREAEEENPQTKQVIDETFKELSSTAKIAIKTLMSPRSTIDNAIKLSGHTKDELKEIYRKFNADIDAAMQKRAAQYIASALASSPGDSLSDIKAALGLIPWDMIPENEADRARVEALKAKKQGKTRPRATKPTATTATGKPAAPKTQPGDPNQIPLPLEGTAADATDHEGIFIPEGPQEGQLDLTLTDSEGDPADHPGIIDLGDPVAIKPIIQVISATRSTWADKIMEFWRMSVLTGPKTAVVNTVSNVLHMAYRSIPLRAAQATTNNVLSLVGLGSKESATFGEFAAMARELRNAATLASRMALQSWRTESRVFEKYAEASVDEAPAAGQGAESFQPAIGGILGTVMRSLSFRHMTMADEFIKFLSGHIEAAAQAHRIAREQEGLRGDAYAARIKKLMEPGSKAWARAMNEAKRITFQEKIDGKDPRFIHRLDQIAELAKKGRAMPWLGRPLTLFIPFVDTPLNIYKEAIKMSPLGLGLAVIDGAHALKRRYRRGNMTVEQAKEEAAKLYDRARLVEDITNQTIALVAYLAISSMVGGDDDDDMPLMTGSMSHKSSKRGERDNAHAVMPPQSFRIGKTFFSYKRIEPFATMISPMADTAIEIDRHAGMTPEVASKMATGFMTQSQDKTFLQGLSNIAQAYENPERFGTGLASSIVTGFVPNIIRQPIRTLDPMLRDTTPRHDDGMFESIARNVGYSLRPEWAPLKISVWGDPIRKNRGELLANNQVADSMLRVIDPTDLTMNPDVDPIDSWIYRYNLKTPDSNDRIGILPIANAIKVQLPGEKQSKMVPLTVEEQTRANVTAGKMARKILGGGWETRPLDEITKKHIVDIVEKSQTAVRAELRAKKIAEAMKKR